MIMITNQKIFPLLIALFLFSGNQLSAYDASPRCFTQLQRNFFRYSTISLALSFYGEIPQSQWSMVNRSLQKKNQMIPQLMREQAARMHSNPLENPFNREVAEDLFRQVLWNVFADVMIRYNVTKRVQIEGAFNFIYKKESKRIIDCLGPRKPWIKTTLIDPIQGD